MVKTKLNEFWRPGGKGHGFSFSMPANVLVRRDCSENRVHNGIVFGLIVDESFSKIDKYVGYLECEDIFEKRLPQVLLGPMSFNLLQKQDNITHAKLSYKILTP